MTESKHDAEYITKLAQRAVSRFGGKLPRGVDAVQDAILVILEWWDKYCPRVYTCAREPFLVMKAWGTLKDKYSRQWAESYPDGVPDTIRHDRENRARYSEDPDAVQLTRSLKTPGQGSIREAAPDRPTDADMDVRAAVSRLPERMAAIMHLMLDGLTQEQIGEQLGITQPRVSQIVTVAKAKLKDMLRDYA